MTCDSRIEKQLEVDVVRTDADHVASIEINVDIGNMSWFDFMEEEEEEEEEVWGICWHRYQ